MRLVPGGRGVVTWTKEDRFRRGISSASHCYKVDYWVYYALLPRGTEM